MKRLIFVIILFPTSLFAQVEHILSLGHEWIVSDDVVYERINKREVFKRAKDIPVVVIGPTAGQVKKYFDGDYLYVAEEVRSKALRIRYADKIDTPQGSRWFWHPSLVMKGNQRFLAVDHRQVMIEERDIIDEAGNRMIQLLSLDLVGENKRVILSLKDPDRVLSMEAVAKDGDFIVFTNAGTIYHLKHGDSSLKELETDVFHKISNDYIDFETNTKGQKIPQPPQFLSSPFFSTTGDIFVPMNIRERNRWSEKAVQAAFDQLTVEEKNRLIEAGKWPLKTDGYDGSDYAFALIGYTCETRKLIRVPSGEVGNLVKVEPNTGQYRLVKPEWPALTEVGDGRFLTIKEAIGDVTPPGARLGDR